MKNVLSAIVGLIITAGFLYGSIRAEDPMTGFCFGLAAFIFGFITVSSSSAGSCSSRNSNTDK